MYNQNLTTLIFLSRNFGLYVFLVFMIPGLRRSPGEGDGNPLQCSRLGNSMNRGAWWAAIHWVTKESDMTYPVNNSNKQTQLLIKCL